MADAAVRGRLIAQCLVGTLVALSLQVEAKSYIVPGSRAAQLEQCVEPTEVMRRKHMELIRHQRDKTVHQGIRSTKHSLSGCVSCHTSYEDGGQAISIVAEGQFCQTCHAHTGVTLDCFDCHASMPTDHLLDAASPGPGLAKRDSSPSEK